MTANHPTTARPEHVPSVLVVLAVRDASAWLRDCLHALSTQTYERLGVLAIDDASVDGSHEQLIHALGPERVVRSDERRGVAASFAAALEHPAVAKADHVLLLHDDAELDPEAVARLVEATHLAGGDSVGIVGAKIVDHDDPRRLLDVGRSADRFGHPYSPLQPGEIDQGQYDRVLEVLSVDSCAVLVRREVWQRVGLFDERLGDDDADLDLCWRARVAGWRVLMTPLARVRHRAAGELDDRPDGVRSRRFEEDRAAFAATLKNAGLLTLLWVVPVALLLSAVRLLYLTLARRFDEASELVVAIGWNVVHLPGTLARRWRVQRARRTKDHALRPFMESAGFRIPRWFQTAEQLLEEQRELIEEEAGQPVAQRLRHRTASLFATHPVLVTSFFAIVVGVFSMRHLLGPATLSGGALPAFPAGPRGFFNELASGFRTTGLGGALAASPALGAMGGLSFLAAGSTALAQKAMLVGGPFLAAILAYRACVRITGRAAPSALAAGAYAASAVLLWVFSEGRLALLVALAVMPALLERLEGAFGDTAPAESRWRFLTGLAITLAVGVAFEPGVGLAFAVLLGVQLIGGARRGRGAAWSLGAVVGAAVLLFPFAPTLAAGGGAAFGSTVGTSEPWDLLRLAPGTAPGSWAPAWFLPVAALAGLAVAEARYRGPALRCAAAGTIALALAWASAAGYLPAAVSNAPVYVVLAAACEATLVALGLSSVLGGMGRQAFGTRQIGAVVLGVALGGGLLLQALAAATGEWAVGADQVPPAWAVVDSTANGRFRVLWLGAADGSRFPAPGGDPEGTVDAGAASVRYGVTGREGALAVDMGRPLQGPGADALGDTIGEIVTTTTVHGGALLAPFGVRYVVADASLLPAAARDALNAQVDLNLVPASGLVIWRSDLALPPAAVLDTDPAEDRLVTSSNPADIQRLLPVPTKALERVPGGWSGPTGGGSRVVVSTEYDGAWQLAGSDVAPERAFGWTTSFRTDAPSATVLYGAQLPRTIATWLLAVVWVAALWITRKPVRR
jgi:GT2 family glycosyltransferase